MPISLELVNFTEAFRIRTVKTIAESFERLGQWLKDRVDRGDALERASRRFPVVWFYNEAVTLWIDPSQWDALAPEEPPPSFGEHLNRGGRRFVAGLEDVVALPRESRIIPDFFSSLLAGVSAIVDSVDRFRTPSKAMFDVRARTAGDLFGEAVLAWRALASSKAQAMKFARVVAVLLESPGSAAMASVADTPDKFERITRYIVAALVMIPALPEFIARVWTELSIFIRASVIEAFAGIEKQVFGVRVSVIDAFYVKLRKTLRDGLVYASAWQFLSTAYLSLFLEVGAIWSKQLIEQIRHWFDDLSKFMNKMIDVFRAFEVLLGELLAVDLMELLVRILSEKWWWSIAEAVADVPVVTIGDLAAAETRAAADRRLQEWLTKVQDRVSGIAGGLFGGLGGAGAEAYLRSKILPVRIILNLALETTTRDVAETGAFKSLVVPKLPDLNATFTTWLAPLRAATSDFVSSLQNQTKDVIDKGTETLDRVARIFERAAAQALRGPAAADYLAISEAAADIAGKLFPSGEEGGPKPPRGFIDLAIIFDEWLARGGIEVVGAVIPRYIQEMRRYWQERQAAGEEETVRLSAEQPTSPHILALRPALARTLVPQVRIDARGRTLDDALVQQIADAFLDRVQEAHRQGLQTLASIKAEAGA